MRWVSLTLISSSLDWNFGDEPHHVSRDYRGRGKWLEILWSILSSTFCCTWRWFLNLKNSCFVLHLTSVHFSSSYQNVMMEARQWNDIAIATLTNSMKSQIHRWDNYTHYDVGSNVLEKAANYGSIDIVNLIYLKVCRREGNQQRQESDLCS